MDIQNTLKINEQISKPLQNIIKSMHMTLNVMEQLNSSTTKDLKLSQTIGLARAEITIANKNIEKMINDINRVDKEAKEVKNSFGGWQGSLTGIYSGIQLIKQGINFGKQITNSLDNLTLINARLNLINDGSQTLYQLQNKIYKASQESRGQYDAMASSVAKLGILAKDAFSSNDETIFFVKQMNKQFKIGGASLQEQQSAMYQLTQAMAAGRLQGDEFRSIMENAPLLAQAIAKELNVSQGKLKDMGREGLITAQVIKNAMIHSAEETNKKFAELPKTWGDIGTMIQNSVIQRLQPLNSTINKLLNSENGMAFVNSIANSLNFVVAVLNAMLNTLISLGSFIYQIRNAIEPFIVTIGIALAYWAYTQIPLLITKLWLMVAPIVAQASAWALANAPMLIVLSTIGLLIYAMLKYGDTTVKVVGFIGGIFGTLFAFLFNKFALFGNVILSIAEFFANVWKDPVYAVKKLFFDLSINALSFLTNIAKGIESIINKIPGLNVDMTSGMTNLLNKLEAERNSLKSDKDVVKLMRINQLDYGTAFNKGQDIGSSVGKFAVDGLNKIGNMIGNSFGSLLDSQNAGLENQNKLFGQGDSQIGSIKDEIHINEEDIKLLKDVAEREAINKITALSPNIQITFGDVRETADVDKIGERLKVILQQEIASEAEGAYAL